MTVTSNDIGNAALQMIGGNQPAVTGQNPTWDSSTAGKALQKLYSFCVATVQRQFGWDASRRLASLTLSGNVAPFPGGYTFEYLYPSNGIEVWLIQPDIVDPYNPLPINFSIGNTLVAGVQTKVIWSNEVSAKIVYNNNPTENVWDAGFREAVVRLLASELAEALSGRPETAASLLQSGAGMGEMAKGRSG